MTLVFNPADPAVRADPHPILARMRNEDPGALEPQAAVVGPDPLRRRQVRARHRATCRPTASTPFYDKLPDDTRDTLAEMMRYLNLWIVFRDPPEHTRVRGLVNKAFLPGTINGFRPRIEQITARLLDRLGR